MAWRLSVHGEAAMLCETLSSPITRFELVVWNIWVHVVVGLWEILDDNTTDT